MNPSRSPDPNIRPCPHAELTTSIHRRLRIALTLLILTLLGGQASVAVEVRQGACPMPWKTLGDDPAPGAETGPCYTAELPGMGYWYIEVAVRVDNPTRRWTKRTHLLEARFELLLAIDQGGAYRLCANDLPPGATVAPISTFMPFDTKEGDPDEIELEPDPLRSEPIIVALVPCRVPTKEGDPDEIELEPDP